MAHKLADETLQAILLPVLAVTEADFADTSPESPFARPGASGTNGAILLVCKRWMRVATPLFYHCVVLRTLPQAQALARTLKSNPALGPLMRQLRIEGGLGAGVGKVMAAATNLYDICILPCFTGRKTNVAALCSALPQVQPRRLILCEPNRIRETKALERLGAALRPAFSTWNRLDKLVISSGALNSVIQAVSMGAQEGGIKVQFVGRVPPDGYASIHYLLKLEDVSVLYIKSEEDYFSWARQIRRDLLGVDAPWEVLGKYRNRIKLKYTDDIPNFIL